MSVPWGHGGPEHTSHTYDQRIYCLICTREEKTDMDTKEAVDHPEHYGGGDNQHEVIKCLRAWGLEDDALAWNAAKYIGRAYKKGEPVENFQKGAWYALRRVAILEGKDPGFYNDLVKAATGTAAAEVRVGAYGDVLCESCASPSMPYGTCHSCGRKWGACADAACEGGRHQWGLVPTTRTPCAGCRKCPGGAGVVHACDVCHEPLLGDNTTGALSFTGERYHGALHFKCQGLPVEDPGRAELRRSGKRPCDAPDCEHEGTEEWEAFWLCGEHRELAPAMPIRILDAMRDAVRQRQSGAPGPEKAQEARCVRCLSPVEGEHDCAAGGHDADYYVKALEESLRLDAARTQEARGYFVEARDKIVQAKGHFTDARNKTVQAKGHFTEAGEAFRVQIADLEDKLVKARASGHRDGLALASISDALNTESGKLIEAYSEINSQKTVVNVLRAELEEARSQVEKHKGCVEVALFDASQIVEKAYGRCRAATDIRAMGSEALRIRPIVDEANFCLGCKGGSVTHTCGKDPDASRCGRCLAMLTPAGVHDCLAMRTPIDHYVTFLESELRVLRDTLVGEFGTTPDRGGAVRAALGLIRGLKGQEAAGRLVNGPGLAGDQTPHQLRVERMMRGFGQEVPEEPLEEANNDLRVLRARLIMEECLETVLDGLRVEVVDRCGGAIDFKGLGFEAKPGEVNMIEMADGCADVSVVTIGTLSAFGIKDAPLLREVDANNQAKVDTATKDEFGKFVKHPDHEPPNIAGVLSAQGWGYQGQAGVTGEAEAI